MTRASLRSLLRDAWGNRFSDWRRFALFLTRNDADAEDLVDEAVGRTLRADPSLKSEGEVHAYMVTAIRNTWFRWRPETCRRQHKLARPVLDLHDARWRGPAYCRTTYHRL